MSAPNPNRYAAPAEAMILRGEIEAQMEMRRALEKRAASAASALHEKEVALQNAQAARDAVQRIIDCIEQQQRSVDEVVLVAQGLLHPIRLLPNETLSMIFEVVPTVQNTVTRADPRQPFAVSAVCRRWRGVALSTTALWSTVHCELPAITDWNTAKCWAAYFEAHCDRSRKLALEVDIIFNEIDPSASATGIWNTLSRVYRRSKRFTLRCGEFTPEMRECLSDYAPYLEEFAFNEPEAIVGRLTLDAPSLKTLVYEGGDLPLSPDAMMYHAIRTVKFTTDSYTARDLIDLFRICPGVQGVDLIAKTVVALTSPGPIAIASPQLNTISLIVGSLMMDFNVAQSFFFPSLQAAHLHITNAPHLDPAVLGIFIASAFRTVTSLELYNPLPGIEQGLAACVGLEDLTVHVDLFGEHAQNFCLALCVSDPAGSRMCPRLSRLSVTASYITLMAADQRFAHAMTAIANARCAASPDLGLRPLDKLNVRFSATSLESWKKALALQNSLDTILEHHKADFLCRTAPVSYLGRT